MKPVCVILAGGRSSRMGGGHKGLLSLGGVSMLDRVLAAVTPQAEAVLINSNGDPVLFEAYGLPVMADSVPGHLGPLAGLLTGMYWARLHHPGATHLLSVPCDSPCLPANLVERLVAGLASQDEIAIARDDARTNPTVGLWPVSLAERLAEDLIGRNVRCMQRWLAQFAVRLVAFDAHCLRNINTPEDLIALDIQLFQRQSAYSDQVSSAPRQAARRNRSPAI